MWKPQAQTLRIEIHNNTTLLEQAQAVKGLTKYHDNKQNITDTVYTERCIREHANFSAIQTHAQKIEKSEKWSFPGPKYKKSVEKIIKYRKGTRIHALSRSTGAQAEM